MASAAEQLAANINFGAFAKAEELKKRIWFTLAALLVYRLGTFIPIPGINPVAFALLNAKLANGSYAIPDPQVLTSANTGYSVISSPAIFHEKQLIVNGDLVISAKERLSVKTLYSRDPTQLPFQTSTSVLGFGESDYHSNVNIALSDTYTISPKMVTLSGLPPNAAMLARTQRSAWIRSSVP